MGTSLGIFKLIGQDYIKDTLIDITAITNPVLFIGPSGIGKRSFALHLVRDVHLIYLKHLVNPAVEEVRSVAKWSKTVAWRSVKVVIFEFDKLNNPSQSAMLKLLEEPPEGFKIIVVATHQAVLPTIISRCHVYRFNILSRADLIKIQLHLGVDENVARASAEFAEGSVEKAIEYAEAQSSLFTSRSLIESRPSLAVENLINFKSIQEMSIFVEQMIKISGSPKLVNIMSDGFGVRGRILLSLVLRK